MERGMIRQITLTGDRKMMNMLKLGTVSPCLCSLTDKQKPIKTKYCACFFIHYAYIGVSRTGTENRTGLLPAISM
jgi:hypothetical protein